MTLEQPFAFCEGLFFCIDISSCMSKYARSDNYGHPHWPSVGIFEYRMQAKRAISSKSGIDFLQSFNSANNAFVFVIKYAE